MSGVFQRISSIWREFCKRRAYGALIHPDGDPDAAGGIVAAPGVFPVVFGEMGMEILQNIVK